MQRIEQRAASGTWRPHTAQELDEYLRAASTMRENAAAEGTFCLDTSELTISAAADAVERWMAAAREQHNDSPTGEC